MRWMDWFSGRIGLCVRAELNTFVSIAFTQGTHAANLFLTAVSLKYPFALENCPAVVRNEKSKPQYNITSCKSP